jgi:hypothetical protein
MANENKAGLEQVLKVAGAAGEEGFVKIFTEMLTKQAEGDGKGMMAPGIMDSIKGTAKEAWGALQDPETRENIGLAALPLATAGIGAMAGGEGGRMKGALKGAAVGAGTSVGLFALLKLVRAMQESGQDNKNRNLGTVAAEGALGFKPTGSGTSTAGVLQ